MWLLVDALFAVANLGGKMNVSDPELPAATRQVMVPSSQ